MSTAATKRRIGVISTVVVALVASLLVWMATRSEGEVVRKADLNDGGVWVTNTEQSRYGRINKAAAQLDARHPRRVVQRLGSRRASRTAPPCSACPRPATRSCRSTRWPAPSPPSRRSALPKASTATGNRVFTAPVVDLRGGTVALIDPATGDLKAQRVDRPQTGISSLDALQTQAKPLAKVGGNAALAVGVDGTHLRPVGREGHHHGAPARGRRRSPSRSRRRSASRRSRPRSPRSARTGSSGTPAPASSGPTRCPSPQQLSVGRRPARQPGIRGAPAAGTRRDRGAHPGRVPADPGAAHRRRPTSGGVKLLAGRAPGSRALPLRSRCGSRRASTPRGPAPSNAYYGRNCGSPGDTDTADLGAMKKGVRTDGVKLRVNRGLIVLNDLDSGAVWDVDRDQVKIDNWNSVIPPPTTDDKNKKKDENLVDDEQSKTPPKAQNDVHAGAARPHLDPARARQRLRLAGLDPRHLAR